MKSMDIKLSEEVANQASKEIVELKSQVEKDKDVHISLLQDVLGDVRDQRQFFKKLCVILCSFVFMAIVGIVVISICNQKTLAEVSYKNIEKVLNFLETADVTIDTSSIPYGACTE